MWNDIEVLIAFMLIWDVSWSRTAVLSIANRCHDLSFGTLLIKHGFPCNSSLYCSRVNNIELWHESRPQTRLSPLTRLRSRRLTLSTLSYHPRWCSYGVMVSWFYLSCDTQHMFWLTLIYTHALYMYWVCVTSCVYIAVCRIIMCSVRT